jgi:hypothetical protein
MLQSDGFGPAHRDLAQREPVFARLTIVYGPPGPVRMARRAASQEPTGPGAYPRRACQDPSMPTRGDGIGRRLPPCGHHSNRITVSPRST